MKKQLFFLLVLSLAVSCGGEEGSFGEPCRSPEDRLEPCDGGLECNPENICEECGGENQLCCESEYIENCHSDNLMCSDEGYCVSCGTENSPCCPGNECDSTLTCGKDNLCFACGYGDRQPCCEGVYCYGNLACVEENCTSQICGEDGSCQPCGGIDELCCAGGACSVDSTCAGEGACIACGGLDEPACANRMCGYWKWNPENKTYTPCECDAWFTNVDGMCSVPFKADPQTDIEICRLAGLRDEIVILPSVTEIESADWCYWYAAYFKNDLSLCDHITWGEMQTICSEGENPEDYFAIITID